MFTSNGVKIARAIGLDRVARFFKAKPGFIDRYWRMSEYDNFDAYYNQQETRMCHCYGTTMRDFVKTRINAAIDGGWSDYERASY